MKRKWLVFNFLILLLVVVVIIFYMWGFDFGEDDLIEDCVEINTLSSFSYDACYDAYSGNIFMEVKRGVDSYVFKSFEVSFFDFEEQSYKIFNLPEVGKSKGYKILADRNPQSVEIVFNFAEHPLYSICEEPKVVFVRYCPVDSYNEKVDVDVSPLSDIAISDFVDVDKLSELDSNVYDTTLVEDEKIWTSQCESVWICSGWGVCVDGAQKRSCDDVNFCFISTDIPKKVRSCSNDCVEDWRCIWSACEGGFSFPDCIDLNDCGTVYEFPPSPIECVSDCVPEFECSNWSSCEVSYNFMDLIKDEIQMIGGKRSRVCADRTGCVDVKREAEDCAVGVDIYTEVSRKCGEDFIEVYNDLTDILIARVSDGDVGDWRLNIYLDGYDNKNYCDYCFNGKKDGDEIGIDGGGSCRDCKIL